MSAASEKEIVRRSAFVASERASIFTMPEARTTYFVLVIVAGAILLRLYGISNYSLEGDEYGSLLEAKSVGLNWNSIVYSTVMHFWVRFGSSELWLRLPAAIFGTATVPIIFKVGERLGGWRTAWVAAILAATSPFNIYHSQEVRFYSLFMLATAAFMLATISYVDSAKSRRDRSIVISAGLFLLISHFLGIIAVSAQSLATLIAAKKRRSASVLTLSIALPVLLFGLPLLPPVRAALLHLYQVYGNAGNASTSMTPVSMVSFAKVVFAVYAFLFGYHVYPLRIVFVALGLGLSAFLLVRGVVQLKRERNWIALAFPYAVALVGVYLVLDSVGGRVAAGVSPRHVAFAWPVLVVLLSIGVSSFSKKIFRVLVIALLAMNAISLYYGWRRDWSYAQATDYRAAAEYALSWNQQNAVVLYAGRAGEPVEFYFPTQMARASWYYSVTPGLSQNDRLVVVADDWTPNGRRVISQFLNRLNENYTLIDGRVDYPLFEYVFDRKSPPEYSSTGAQARLHQLQLPQSAYGVEFQDLKLPIEVNTKGARLKVSGAAELPNMDDEKRITVSLSQAARAARVILLTSVTGQSLPAQGTVVAELVVETPTGAAINLPIRLGIDTASWDQICPPGANCETAFQWHKRLALVGQNSYPGAWRDFSARVHAVSLDLPKTTDVSKVSIRYLPSRGHLYIWGLALNEG